MVCSCDIRAKIISRRQNNGVGTAQLHIDSRFYNQEDNHANDEEIDEDQDSQGLAEPKTIMEKMRHLGKASIKLSQRPQKKATGFRN